MFVIKGLVDNKIDNDKVAYFVKIEEQILWGKPFEVRVCSAVISGATMYSTYQEALDVIQEYELHNFEVYPVCPRCHKDYDGHPAISRKDNTTEICSSCGTQEAMFDFINHIKKNRATD